MCNLYRMSKSQDEVAQFFSTIVQDMRVIPGNAPEDIFPGYPGVVVADGLVQQMTWGFPLARKGAKGQPLKPKPINNARADKLSSPFWASSFRSRRCLIPITEFAEAEGPPGARTRTWFSLKDSDLFAVAGFWRETVEWGKAYTMVMCDACSQVEGVHDRMPVILPRESWDSWLGDDPRAAFGLCSPYPGDMRVRRTDTLWAGRR